MFPTTVVLSFLLVCKDVGAVGIFSELLGYLLVTSPLTLHLSWRNVGPIKAGCLGDFQRYRFTVLSLLTLSYYTHY